MTRRLLAAALAAVVLVGGLGACDDSDPSADVPESNIDVDTPKLREMKADAGIEPCEPGPGGGALPGLELACLGGGSSVDLASLKGPLVINLWNTACGPCRDEMPALQQFHEAYGDQVRLLGIDVTDTQPDLAISFAQLVGATYPQLADPGGNIFDEEALGLRASFPQFLFVDAQGRLAGKYASSGLDSVGEVVDLVATYLDVELAPS